MAEFILSVETLCTGDAILSNQTIEVKDGQITSIKPYNANHPLPLKGILTAGFIDVQVNGGGGYLFNQSPQFKTLKQIALAHQCFGTTGWMPTLVTDSEAQMKLAADAVAQARLDSQLGVLGIHFEGPHLSVPKKGIHDEQFIRGFSAAEEAIFKRQDLGKVIVTLAPEIVSPEQIKQLVSAGVIISIGHSNASFKQTQQAIKAGASGFTHLFNAMSQFNSREPGVVGAALLAENTYSGIIMDGHHVHPASARVASNSKTNLMLVTDAMPVVGTELEEFKFFGEIINRQGTKLTNTKGNLAGSALNMAMAVKNSLEMLQLPQIEVFKLASRNPAKFLELDNQYGNLQVGKKASMVLLDESGSVISCWVEGAKQV